MNKLYSLYCLVLLVAFAYANHKGYGMTELVTGGPHKGPGVHYHK
jgi:hypothetical protein